LPAAFPTYHLVQLRRNRDCGLGAKAFCLGVQSKECDCDKAPRRTLYEARKLEGFGRTKAGVP